MQLSQKCQYAVRAVLELSKLSSGDSLKIAEIAERQSIPQRFLENILGQLKGVGLLESERGKRGGYRLARNPADIFVGEIIRIIDGPVAPVDCLRGSRTCTVDIDLCVLVGVWRKAEKALSDIYDNTSFASLVEEAKNKRQQKYPDFFI